ncbi:MAG TPA: hypothetical protein VGH76_05770 [Actinomycetospora sp.]|jgi:hypothetical protein|uniref:hypothetical protein n=1 Tax=Actinomycetospora sp. TaxID=1872135 RepID=UPI002F3F26C6
MRIAVFLPPLLPLLAIRGAMPLAHRLPPRLAAWLLTGAAVVLAVCSTAALALLAATAALRMPLLADLERYSLTVVSHDDRASIRVALVAGALLAAAAVGLGRVATQRARAALATHRHSRALPGRDQRRALHPGGPAGLRGLLELARHAVTG